VSKEVIRIIPAPKEHPNPIPSIVFRKLMFSPEADTPNRHAITP